MRIYYGSIIPDDKIYLGKGQRTSGHFKMVYVVQEVFILALKNCTLLKIFLDIINPGNICGVLDRKVVYIL